MIRPHVLLLCVSCLLPPVEAVVAEERPVDQVCELLFRDYLAHTRRTSKDTIRAAEHLIAERGRVNGYWKVILQQLEENAPVNEVSCLRMLGKMLAADASDREAIQRQKETGEIDPRIPTVYLAPEVVAALIERGKKADRNKVDHYAVALARARSPEAKEFFTSLLNQKNPEPTEKNVSIPEGPYHRPTTLFHAAVGLANVGDTVGIEWLIEHSGFDQGDVSGAYPAFVSRGTSSVGPCSTAALQELFDQRGLHTQSDWKEWWANADKQRPQQGRITLVDF